MARFNPSNIKQEVDNEELREPNYSSNEEVLTELAAQIKSEDQCSSPVAPLARVLLYEDADRSNIHTQSTTQSDITANLRSLTPKTTKKGRPSGKCSQEEQEKLVSIGRKYRKVRMDKKLSQTKLAVVLNQATNSTKLKQNGISMFENAKYTAQKMAEIEGFYVQWIGHV
ncbi:hypothetical protein M3Y96_00397700 [Aphelenchoides besseyi]|nr:hypothetical protein M3Y96_00397700 [Aphelenchoides besseyi]